MRDKFATVAAVFVPLGFIGGVDGGKRRACHRQCHFLVRHIPNCQTEVLISDGCRGVTKCCGQ